MYKEELDDIEEKENDENTTSPRSNNDKGAAEPKDLQEPKTDQTGQENTSPREHEQTKNNKAPALVNQVIERQKKNEELKKSKAKRQDSKYTRAITSIGKQKSKNPLNPLKTKFTQSSVPGFIKQQTKSQLVSPGFKYEKNDDDFHNSQEDKESKLSKVDEQKDDDFQRIGDDQNQQSNLKPDTKKEDNDACSVNSFKTDKSFDNDGAEEQKSPQAKVEEVPPSGFSTEVEDSDDDKPEKREPEYSEKDKKEHYILAERQPGDAKSRIGEIFQLREDIYSLSVVVQRKPFEGEENGYIKIKSGSFGKQRVEQKDHIQNRTIYLSYTVLCWLAQISLALMIFFGEDNKIEAGSVYMTMARFICVTLLHMFMFDECRQGLNIMKYSVNHSHEFEYPVIVFLVGLMQFSMVLVVEAANMYVICTSEYIIDVIKDFIAIEIIAEFDDFFYQALPAKQKVNLDMNLLIKHTSSNRVQKHLGETPTKENAKEVKVYWVAIKDKKQKYDASRYKVTAVTDMDQYERSKGHKEQLGKAMFKKFKENMNALYPMAKQPEDDHSNANLQAEQSELSKLLQEKKKDEKKDDDEKSKEKLPKEILVYAKVMNRSCCNKFQFGIYKVCRSIYVSFYFYYFTLGVLFIMFFVPFLNQDKTE